MAPYAVANSSVVPEGQSIDEWILEALRKRGAQTLDHLSRALPTLGWAPLFFAIDRLSRAGEITIRPAESGDYLVSATSVAGLANFAF